MVTTLVALLALFAFSASAWGWGRSVLNASRGESLGGVAYPVAIGLAALAAVGGWLNVFSLAYPPILWALLAIGWIAAFKNVRSAKIPHWKTATTGPALVLAGVILLVGLFLDVTLLPGGAFNPGDDLVTYFARSTRMLQTGTIGHDPFSPLGLESLGAHSFLQAFTLLVFGPGFLNAFDAVMCVVLSLGLIAEIGTYLKTHRALICSALATAILIHPSQVNISAVYAITSLSLAMVLATAELLRSPDIPLQDLWRRVLPLALLIAALAALKSTTWLFLIGSSSLLLLLVTFDRGVRFSVRTAVRVTAVTFVFVFPWIVLSADKYSQVIRKETRETFFVVVGNPAELLGSAELFWGGTPRTFTAVAIFVLLVCGIATWQCIRAQAKRCNFATNPLIALCGGAAITYLLNIIPHDVVHCVRYSAPLLIAGAASAVLLGGHLLSEADGLQGRSQTGIASLRPLLFACVVPLAASVMFATTMKFRVWNAITNGSTLSFPQGIARDNVKHAAWALSPEARQSIVRLQAQTIPGQQILALVAVPFHFLFTRNPIFVGFEFGMAWPWLDVPLDADAVEFRRFLHRHGIRYVIWEKEGPAIGREEDFTQYLNDESPLFRKSARQALSFHQSMSALAADSKVIYQERNTLVVDVGLTPPIQP